MLKINQICSYLEHWRVGTRLLIVLIVLSFVVGCGDLDISPPIFPWSPHAIRRNGCRKYDPATFAEKVMAIDCKIGDRAFPDSLFQAKDFMAIYRYPQYYHSHIRLRPYPFPSKLHHSLSLSPKAQRDIKHYQEQQAEQDSLRKRYAIPSYDDHKPFYCFDRRELFEDF